MTAKKEEKPIVIELYELWNSIKSRFNIVSPQPKSFTLDLKVRPVIPLVGAEVLIVDLTDTATVAIAGTAIKDHAPPAGYVDHIKALFLNVAIPAGGSSGNHYFYLTNATDEVIVYAYAYSAFDTAIKWTFSQFHTKTGSAPNMTYIDVTGILARIPITADFPFRIKYENATDVQQANARDIKLLIERTLVGVN